MNKKDYTRLFLPHNKFTIRIQKAIEIKIANYSALIGNKK